MWLRSTLLVGTVAGILSGWVCSPPPSGPAVARRQTDIAGSATRVIAAIHRYQHEVGLWPRDLAELSPEFGDRGDLRRWRYEWSYNGHWRLLNVAGFPDWGVEYLYWAGAGGRWQTIDGDPLHPKAGVPEMPLLPVVPKQMKSRRRAELVRRVAAYPREIEHQRGLATLLYREGIWRKQRRYATLPFARSRSTGGRTQCVPSFGPSWAARPRAKRH